jgi:hypothetical protein
VSVKANTNRQCFWLSLFVLQTIENNVLATQAHR